MAEKSLEELLLETEQRILNKDFYKRIILTYDGEDYEFYIKPVTQRTLMQLYAKYDQDDYANIAKGIIADCLIKEDGTKYDEKLIDILMDKLPAGASTDIIKPIYEISGITTNNASDGVVGFPAKTP